MGVETYDQSLKMKPNRSLIWKPPPHFGSFSPPYPPLSAQLTLSPPQTKRSSSTRLYPRLHPTFLAGIALLSSPLLSLQPPPHLIPSLIHPSRQGPSRPPVPLSPHRPPPFSPTQRRSSRHAREPGAGGDADRTRALEGFPARAG